MEYGSWTKSKKFGGYVSPDLVEGNVYGILNVKKDFIKFGFLIPYDQCFFRESYAEPFGNVHVLGAYHDFRMTCLEKNVAVVFPNQYYVSQQIVQSFSENKNLCLIVDKTKLCFEGKGVSDLVSDSGVSITN